LVQFTRVLRIALVASLALFAFTQAGAQTLPDLTVTALAVTSDRVAAPEGEAFHLRIHVRTKQHGADLSSLVLPDVVNLTILGDEKHTAPVSGDGTDYVEILTVAGVAPGEATVSPAYIDARDPSRGDRPFRFSSNSLRLRITATSTQTDLLPWRNMLFAVVRAVLVCMIAVVVLAGFGFAIVRVRAVGARRRKVVTLPPARPITPQPTPLDRLDDVRTGARTLGTSRTREAAAALRLALFTLAGARADETLSKLLSRLPPDQGALRAALRAAERATFVDDAHLQGAIDELLDAVREVVSR
jgi:hypothetical protein